MNAILRFSGWNQRARLAAVLMALLGLTACGGNSTPAPTATPAPTSTPTLPTPTPMVATIETIIWAKGIDAATGAPLNQTSSFAPDAPAIYAAMPVKNVTPGLTLTASWSYNGTELNGVGATVVATEPMASGWIEFHLSQAAGQLWPVGTYEISVAQSGAQPVTSEIEVKRAGS
jgi:hypothetical protein